MIPDYKTDSLFQRDIAYSIWKSVSLPVMIVRKDDLVVLEANPQAKLIFSGTCQFIPGTRIDNLGIWPDNQESKEFLKELNGMDKIVNFELRLLVDKDRTGDFLLNTDEIEISGIRFKLLMMREITESKVAERFARDRQTFFESIINSLPELIIIHDEGKILFANKIFKTIFGISDDDLSGKQLDDYIRLPKNNYHTKPNGNVLMHGNKPGMLNEIQLDLPDGTVRHYSLDTLPIKYAEDDMLMLILIDTTERKNLEQAMMAKAMESIERERNMLVENLHDDLGPDLSTIRLLLSSIGELARNDEHFSPRLSQCLSYIDSVITKLKSITAHISPEIVDRFGLHSSLSALITKLTVGKTLHINFVSNIQNLRFPSKVEINLYRVISELIENTIEHSGASLADLKVKYGCKELSVVYKDNGKGFDVGSISLNDSGSGILNMINRVNSINGKIDFKEYQGQVITVVKVIAEPDR